MSKPSDKYQKKDSIGIDSLQSKKTFQTSNEPTESMESRIKELKRSLTNVKTQKKEWYKNHNGGLRVPKTNRLDWKEVNSFQSALQPLRGKKREAPFNKKKNRNNSKNHNTIKELPEEKSDINRNDLPEGPTIRLKKSFKKQVNTGPISKKSINRKTTMGKLDMDRSMQTRDIEGASPNKFSHFHKKYDVYQYSNSKDSMSEILSMPYRKRTISRDRSLSVDKSKPNQVLKNNGTQILSKYKKSPNIQNTIHIKEDKKYSQRREGRMKSEANLADKSQLQKKLASIGTNLEIKTGYDDMVYSKTPSSNLPKISNGLAKGGFLKEKINSMYKKSIPNSNLLNAAASAHKDALVKKMKKVHLSRDFRDRNRLLDPQVSLNPSPYKHKASDVLEKSVLKSSLRPIERPIETYLPEASKGGILRRSENSLNKLAASLSNHVTPSKAAPSYSPQNPSSNPLHSRNKSFTNTGSRNNSMHHLGHNLHANPQPLLSHLHSSFQKTPLTRRHPLLFKKSRVRQNLLALLNKPLKNPIGSNFNPISNTFGP
ncbi:unnamed protein product [Moneuplotes crassus]|uniref:Uncharacterized protein n=1 Tax=Euplotes crassus TaxID=5936 RepID=A0AAD2DAP7_EUPCR|nr:unnamed protein product [Moneuplotes crassus]